MQRYPTSWIFDLDSSAIVYTNDDKPFWRSDEEWAVGWGGVSEMDVTVIKFGDWENITVKSKWGEIVGFHIYEPPPGGVKEMLAMRKSESD